MAKLPQPLGVGIIGTGWVAGAHIDNFKQIDGCKIVAICSRDEGRARAKAAEHGVSDAVGYDDLASFLKHPDLDIVVICTPHPNHPAESITAARAGKHVVIEKPVALNRQDLRKMLAAVGKAGVKTSVCFELRWIGVFRNIKAMLAQDLIGNLFYGECSYFHGIGPWYEQWKWNVKEAVAGDALLTAGCHALDGLIWLMGSKVVEVAGMSNTSRHNPLKYEYDPNSVVILRFANGAIGKVATSVECRQPYLFPILLQGDKGTIWNDQIWTTDWPGTPKDRWARVPAAVPDSGDVKYHPYLGQLQHFVDCIRNDERPSNDLTDCAHVHEVMFAVQEAIRTRRTVKVQG
jgi:predicted dehydrogenase